MSDVQQQPFAESSGFGSFFVGLFCGAALGAALGVMFAPKRGVDLRNDLAQSAERLRRRTSDMYGGATRAVSDVVNRGRSAVQAGRDAFQQAPFPGDAAAEARFSSEGGH